MDETARGQLNLSMAALADGERSAFDPVYRALWPVLVRFVRALSRDRTLSEDIAQEAMLKIFSRAATFDRYQDALTWSLAIAANEYRSHRRKHANRATDTGEQISTEPSDDETPEAIAIRNNLCDAATTVLSQLRPHDLEVIIAAMCEGPRPALSPAAFRKRLQRALARTRVIWKRHYGSDQVG